MTLYDQISAIAESKMPLGYLRAYVADLTKHDFATLQDATPGARFIWILRENGTELFRIADGKDPVWATYWLREGSYSRDLPNLAYLLDGGSNRVQPITYAQAGELARIPPADGIWRKFRLS